MDDKTKEMMAAINRAGGVLAVSHKLRKPFMNVNSWYYGYSSPDWANMEAIKNMAEVQ